MRKRDSIDALRKHFLGYFFQFAFTFYVERFGQSCAFATYDDLLPAHRITELGMNQSSVLSEGMGNGSIHPEEAQEVAMLL